MPAMVPHGLRNVGEESVRVAGFFSSNVIVSTFDQPLMPFGLASGRYLFPSLPRKRSPQGTPTSEQYVQLGSHRSITGKPKDSLIKEGHKNVLEGRV